MTIFVASKNNAELRLRTVLNTGVDPGSTATAEEIGAAIPASEVGDVIDPTPSVNLESLR